MYALFVAYRTEPVTVSPVASADAGFFCALQVSGEDVLADLNAVSGDQIQEFKAAILINGLAQTGFCAGNTLQQTRVD